MSSSTSPRARLRSARLPKVALSGFVFHHRKCARQPSTCCLDIPRETQHRFCGGNPRPTSLDSAPAGVLREAKGGRLPDEHRRSFASPWRAAGAVSYTHLRAHETPEHLVCRLLLEK